MPQRGNIPQFTFDDPGPQQAGGQLPTTGQLPTRQVQPLNFEAIQQGIAGWQQRVQRREEEKAMRAQQEAAIVRQHELGAQRVSQADPELAYRFQQAYQETAREVYQQKLSVEAQRTRGRLAMEHRNDPEGFRKAWKEYTDTTYEALRQQDPAFASQIHQTITDEGEGTALKLEQNKFARDHAMQAAEVQSLIRERAIEQGNELRQDPSEETYYGSIESIHMVIDDQVDKGMIDIDTGEKLKEQYHEQLTTDYVWGEFYQSMGTGDVERTQELIEDLQYGRIYRDNEQGRRVSENMAQRLQAELDAQGQEVEDQFNFYKDQLGRFNWMAQEGRLGSEDMDRVEQTAHKAVQFAQTEEEYKSIQQEVANVHSTTMVKEMVNKHGNAFNLADQKDQIDQMFEAGEIDGQTYSNLQGIMGTEAERINQAVRDNDMVAIAGREVNIYDTTLEELHTRRKEALHKAGGAISPDQVGLWTEDEITQFDQDLDRAINRGEYEQATQLIDNFFGPVIGDENAMIRATRQLEKHGGLGAAVAAFAEAGDMQAVSDILGYYSTGHDMSRSEIRELSDDRIDVADYTRDSDVQRIINTLSAGSPQMANELTVAMEGTVKGLVRHFHNQGYEGRGLRSVVEDNFKRMMTPFGTNAVEVTDGIYMQERHAPTGEFRQKIRDHLEDPVKYFEDENLASDIAMASIVPVPTDRGIKFRSNTTLTYINAPGSQEAYVLPYPDEETLDQSRTGVRSDGELIGVSAGETIERESDPFHKFREEHWPRIKGIGETVANWATDELGRSTRASITHYYHGVGDRLERLHQALQRLSDEDPENVVSSQSHFPTEYGLRLDAEDEVRWDRVEEAYNRAHLIPFNRYKQQQMEHKSSAPFIAADLIDQYITRFEGDEKSAWASYFMGPDNVEEIQGEYGDSWYGELPRDVRTTIRKVMGDGR